MNSTKKSKKSKKITIPTRRFKKNIGTTIEENEI